MSFVFQDVGTPFHHLLNGIVCSLIFSTSHLDFNSFTVLIFPGVYQCPPTGLNKEESKIK